jgi:hypothetical protein
LLFNNKAVYNTILTTKLFRLELRRFFGVLSLHVMQYAISLYMTTFSKLFGICGIE